MCNNNACTVPCQRKLREHKRSLDLQKIGMVFQFIRHICCCLARQKSVASWIPVISLMASNEIRLRRYRKKEEEEEKELATHQHFPPSIQFQKEKKRTNSTSVPILFLLLSDNNNMYCISVHIMFWSVQNLDNFISYMHMQIDSMTDYTCPG